MPNKTQILESIINFSKPIDILEKEVVGLIWDSELELVEIKESHLKEVEERLKAGSLKANDVETWANLIEAREDIKFETDAVKENIERLANPTL